MKYFSKDLSKRIGFTVGVTGFGLLCFLIRLYMDWHLSHEARLVWDEIALGIVAVPLR